MAAKPCYGQEEGNSVKCKCNSLALTKLATSHQVEENLSKPMQAVENTSALKLSVIISNSGVIECNMADEDNIWSQGTQEELSNLASLLLNIFVRISNSCGPILPINPLHEALDAEGKKLPVKLLRKYVRCLYHEVSKLCETNIRSSRICTWSSRPADWPANIPFQDPNNSVQSKRPSKRDLQAMFDHLAAKYRKLVAANQFSVEESSDELQILNDTMFNELGIVSEAEGLKLFDCQYLELESTLQKQLLSTSHMVSKPDILMNGKTVYKQDEKVALHSNTFYKNQREYSKLIRITAGGAVEACDEVQEL